jgi:hypothetical protein
MRAIKICNAVVATILVGLSVSNAQAHHSGSMYDPVKTVSLEGVVKDWQWTNPHSFLQVMARDPNGKSVEWSCELGASVLLGRTGWKRTSFKPGDKVMVVVHPLKSGADGGTVVKATNETDHGIVYVYHAL